MIGVIISVLLAQSSPLAAPLFNPPPMWKILPLPPAPPRTAQILTEYLGPSGSSIQIVRDPKAAVDTDIAQDTKTFALLMPGIAPVHSEVTLCSGATGKMLVFTADDQVKVAVLYATAGGDVLEARYFHHENTAAEPEAVTALKSLCPSGALP